MKVNVNLLFIMLANILASQSVSFVFPQKLLAVVAGAMLLTVGFSQPLVETADQILRG